MSEMATDVKTHISAQAYLAMSGWMCHVEVNQNGDDVYFAAHPQYPEQSGLTLAELVRRCNWAETHRTPRPHSE